MDRIGRIGLALLGLVAVLGLYIAGTTLAKSQEIEIGAGVICDTAPQMQRFVQIARDDPQATAEAVNREFDSPTACMLGQFAFARGNIVASENGWAITEVAIVAVYMPHGWQRIQPHVFYTAFKPEERGA